MGLSQSQMALASQTYSYFRPKLTNNGSGAAAAYNGANYLENKYRAGTDGDPTKTFQEAMNIFGMLDNDNSDDLTTYLMILQSQPINVLLLGQSMTSYNFNIDSSSANSIGTKVSNIIQVCCNVTGQKYVTDTYILGGTNDIQEKSDLEKIVEENSLNNAWALTKDGRLLYHFTKSGDSDFQRGVMMFKCLADWFNALDNIQNTYINYLFNTARYSQTYIRSLVNAADLTYSNYAQVFNDILEKRVSGGSIVEIDSSSFVVFMKTDTEEQNNIKLILKQNEFGEITKAKLGNGEDVTVEGSSGPGATQLTDIGHYAYNLNKDKDWTEENVKSMWKCFKDGKWWVLVYSPTYFSEGKEVYYLWPLNQFVAFSERDHTDSASYGTTTQTYTVTGEYNTITWSPSAPTGTTTGSIADSTITYPVGYTLTGTEPNLTLTDGTNIYTGTLSNSV